MATKTIEAIGVVDEDGILTVSIPTDMTPGKHTVALLLPQEDIEKLDSSSLDWMLIEVGEIIGKFPPGREELYDDFGL